MTRLPKTREEAEHDIEQLYGWSHEHYGRKSQVTDEEVIQIAWDQISFEESFGLTTRKYEHKINADFVNLVTAALNDEIGIM